MQEEKQGVTKVVSLVKKIAENLPNLKHMVLVWIISELIYLFTSGCNYDNHS